MNYKEKEKLERQYRIWKMFLYVFGTVCFIVFLYLCRFIGFAVHRYRQNKMIKSAVVQIAQLTSNIRVFYAVHSDEPIPSIQKMVEVGALPMSLFSDNTITNPFGGQIIIEQAQSLRDKKGRLISPTFKIAYQGLSQEACVRMLTIDWGGKKQGLVAVAAGHKQPDGSDTALTDIDDDFIRRQTVEKTDKDGKKRLIQAAVHYKLNVARPNDNFQPTPFSEEAAYIACDCEAYDNCSVALNYTLLDSIKRAF